MRTYACTVRAFDRAITDELTERTSSVSQMAGWATQRLMTTFRALVSAARPKVS